MAVIFLAAALEDKRVGGVVDHHAALAAARSSGRRGCASGARCSCAGGGAGATDELVQGLGQLLGIGVAHGVGKVSAACLHGTELVEFLDPVKHMRHHLLGGGENEHAVDRRQRDEGDGVASA